jgi:hypothetical protein
MLMFDVASVAAGGFEEAIDACPNVQELLGNHHHAQVSYPQ